MSKILKNVIIPNLLKCILHLLLFLGGEKCQVHSIPEFYLRHSHVRLQLDSLNFATLWLIGFIKIPGIELLHYMGPRVYCTLDGHIQPTTPSSQGYAPN